MGCFLCMKSQSGPFLSRLSMYVTDLAMHEISVGTPPDAMPACVKVVAQSRNVLVANHPTHFHWTSSRMFWPYQFSVLHVGSWDS